uniref:Indoleamine 2,3-dioxygenase 1 n=1 Tax=Mastacembelus armatus TaxID=205130 RepID=A0A3Q3M1L5_9TELE
FSMAAAETDSNAPFSLERYYVSEELGFILPEPLVELPPYYKPWMDISLRVPELVHSHMLRDHVNKMPLLSSSFLQKHRELRLAHLTLSVMTMGYVWQEGENDTVEMLPYNLAVPYWEVSQRLGLPPILTHADGVLANWRKKDPKGPFDMENLELLVSLPGGESVRCFFIVTLLVELAAVPALRSIPTVINGIRGGDTQAVARALDNIGIHSSTLNILIIIKKNFNSLFILLRHFKDLSVWVWWKDNPSMPKGLIYEGVQTEPMEFSGGSAAQSSLLHCFDKLLGIQHESNSAFLTRMRNYMPPAHKQLIHDISLQPSLRGFVQQQADERLNQTFHLCVKKLLALRNYHINVVSRFITVPAARARQLRNQSQDLEEEMISRAPTALEERGTGGSGIMTFLKTVRDQTKDAFLSETNKINE